MDQTLQARLIGATVLVALAVLLVPELLSGRKSVEPAVDEGAVARGTRSFTIELGTPGGQASIPVPPAHSATATATRAPAPTGELEPPEATAGSVAGVEAPAIVDAPGAPQPPPQQTAAVPQPALASEAGPAPAAAPEAVKAGGWVVQVGAFGSADAARRLVDELAAAGFEAHLAPVARSGRTLHRVRVGPASVRPSAEQLAQRLKARGLPAAVVEND